MTKVNKKITYILAAVMSVVLFVITAFSSGGVANVYAADSSKVVYSDVLADLKKDSSFNTGYYPENVDDNSLQVIQIAESSDKELFVYVYQPSGQAKKLSASSINISTTINDAISFYNYKLQLLNSNGVFFKYKVSGFTVKSDPMRYYAITAIYRPFDENIDDPASGDNKITEVDYDVSKQYCFGMINGKPYVNVVELETITITDKFVGFVRYSNGDFLPVWISKACDSHFVAFNTDKPIDKLLEAYVEYTTQSYNYQMINYVQKETFGKKTPKGVTLNYTEKVSYTGTGLFAGTYKWDRIETVEQFISENDLTQDVYSGAMFDVNVMNKITDEGKANLKGKKWVLRFAETNYSNVKGTIAGNFENSRTIVGDVSILRLKYEFDGITYNLGVIDNKQSGSGDPINYEKYYVEAKDWVKILLGLIALVVLLIICWPVLPYIFRFVGWIIALPFKGISAIVNSVKKRRKKKE